MPYAIYIVWAALYFMFNFWVKAKKIKDKKYHTLYRKFKLIKWSRKILQKVGKKWSGLVFMTFHLGYFTVSHLFSLVCLYSEFMHTFLMCFFLFVMVWNGSAYYVKFFKYTQTLTQQ